VHFNVHLVDKIEEIISATQAITLSCFRIMTMSVLIAPRSDSQAELPHNTCK